VCGQFRKHFVKGWGSQIRMLISLFDRILFHIAKKKDKKPIVGADERMNHQPCDVVPCMPFQKDKIC